MRRIVLILIAIAVFSLFAPSKTTAQGSLGEYSCMWQPTSWSTGECVANLDTSVGLGCTAKSIPGNACDGLDQTECLNNSFQKGVTFSCEPVAPGSPGTGFRCNSPNPTCSVCDLSEPDCYDVEEDFCNQACNLNGGITYKCTGSSGCSAVTDLSGEISLTSCEINCGVPVKTGLADLTCTKNGITGINTAIGCIPIQSRTDMMAFLIAWSIGVSGGTGLLLIIYSAFLFIISNGNPQRVQAAKEALLSAISGLILLILAVYLLKVIGIDILGLEQLGV